MTKTTNTFAAAIAMTAALAFTTTSASAEKIATLTSGAWKGGAYTSNSTGDFSHCAANARYKSGVALLFSVTRNRCGSDALQALPLRHPLCAPTGQGPVLQRGLHLRPI